jgi:hypothetical protein
MWSAAPVIIEYLITINPSAVSTPDSLRKTPLHYTGEFYPQHEMNPNRTMLQVLRLLLDAAPHSVNHEDNDENTAIEYATMNLVDMKVVNIIMLQKACIRNGLNYDYYNHSVA